MNKRIFLYLIVIALSLIAMLWIVTHPKQISIDGGCSDINSPYIHKHFNDGRKITFCDGGDRFTGDIKSQEFVAGKYISFSYAGYPARFGIELNLKSPDGEFSPINIDLPDAGEVWVDYQMRIPQTLIGKKFALSGRDSASSSFGWLGLGSLENHDMAESVETTLITILFVLILSLMLISILAILLAKFETNLALGLLVLSFGVYGYLTFFAYIISHKIGLFLSASSFVIVFMMWRWIFKFKKFTEFKRATNFILPIAALALFILFLGFYPLSDMGNDFWKIASNKWKLHLPIDSWIPKIFADQVWGGNVSRPMVGDWYSSDRPPLQTGLYLIFYPLFPGNSAIYQALGTMAQLMFVPALWALITKLGYSKYRCSMLIGASFTGLVLVHSLFVWPKLLSASYALFCFIFLWFIAPSRMRMFGVGVFAALSMLSHGGAFFALFGIFLVWSMHEISLGRYRKLSLDLICWGAIFLGVMLPWFFYGKYIDPQTGRLIKWHLAGVIQPSSAPIFDAILEAYKSLSLSDWIKGRLENLFLIVRGSVFIELSGGFSGALRQTLSINTFYQFFYSMWFFSPIIALIVWVIGGCRPLPRNLWILFISATSSLLIWLLLMFEPGSTTIHQGSFFTWFAFFVWAAIIISEISRTLYFFALFSNVFLAIYIYISDGLLDNGGDYIYIGILFTLGLIFSVSLVILDKEEKILCRHGMEKIE